MCDTVYPRCTPVSGMLADSQLHLQLPHWLRSPSTHSQLLQLTSDDFPVQGNYSPLARKYELKIDYSQLE